ncbi:MAG: GHKL domain-containing protein, partial [Sphingomonadales bacterium]|nr:GHKL domain-containing protein [Sphingomonadales bacterium]
QQKLMDVILDDVERLDRLITDISDASRLDAELSRGEIQPVNLAGILGTLADIHTHTAAQGAPSLTFAAEDGLIVDAMEDRLVQVFRNLLSNAISFSPASDTAAIRLNAYREGGFIIATVEDDGPGIPEGNQLKIFNRFYTERPEAEEFGRHSGLGLSISKQIIEAHGGTLTASNTTAKDGSITGACFTVKLPAA